MSSWGYGDVTDEQARQIADEWAADALLEIEGETAPSNDEHGYLPRAEVADSLPSPPPVAEEAP